MNYVRLYATPDGESHFEDVELEMQEAYAAAFSGQIGRSEPMTVAAVWFGRHPAPAAEHSSDWGAWHPAPRRQFVVSLQGESEIEASDGEVRRAGPGSVVLAEDTSGRGHRNRVLSDRQVLYIALPD